MTEKRREPTTKTPPDKTPPDMDSLTDAPASQPEVLKKSKDEIGREIPSQAQGDRETIEKDLYDKDPRKKS